MKKKNLKKILIAIFLLSLLLSFLFSFNSNVYELHNNIIDRQVWKKTKNLSNKRVIQTFKANMDTCDGASVMVDTKDYNKKDYFIAELHSIKGSRIAFGKIGFDKVKHGDFTNISFDKKVKINRGEKYYICFRTRSSKKTKVYYYIVNDGNKEGHVVDTVRVAGTLASSMTYGDFSIVFFIFGFIVIAFILFILLYMYLKTKANKKRKN